MQNCIPVGQYSPASSIQGQEDISQAEFLDEALPHTMDAMWSMPVCGPCEPSQIMVPLFQPTMMVAPIMHIGSLAAIDGADAIGYDLPEIAPFMPTIASVGSNGHPFCCAEPCKYFSKQRGCKDGAACDRCHLCSWKSQKNPKHGSRAKGSTR
jgi:hypothetical protein